MESIKFLVRTDDWLHNEPSVLIGRKGTINRPMYIDTPFWTVDTLFYTKITKEYLAKWLYYVVININLEKYNEATGVPSLSVANLNRIKIASPSYEEQMQIVNILTAIDDRITVFVKEKNELLQFKKGLMQQLLTGKTRVKIDN